MRSTSLALSFALLTGVAAEAHAAPPGWASGKDPRYSSAEYLLGVGKGPKQESADLDARAEISRIFESKIQSVMEDFQGAASSVNSSGKGVSIEVQAIAQFTKVTTSKTLKGVEIRERGADGKTSYALAVLDRAQCVSSLTEEIETLDQKINGAVQTAEGGDKLKAFKGYGQALNYMDEREALNAMLRVCDKRGKGIPPTMSIGDIAAKFDEASGNFNLGIDLQGSGAERVRDCLMEALNSKGYQIQVIEVDEEEPEEEDLESDESEGGSKYDAVLKGTIKTSKAGETAGSVMVRADVTIKLINPKTKKVLKTFTGNRKEGRRDVKSSAALAAHKICQNEAPKIASAIDQYFKR